MKPGAAARLLTLSGVVVTVLGFAKFHASQVADPPYDFTASFRLLPTIGYTLLVVVGAYAAGMPDRRRSTRLGDLVVGLLVVGSAAMALSAVQLAVGAALLPRFVVFGSMMVLPLWFLLCQAAAGDLDTHAQASERVLVVGDLADVSAVLVDLDVRAERPAVIVDIVVPESVGDTRGRGALVELATERRATLLVLDNHAQAHLGVVRQAAQLHEHGVRVRTLVGFYEEWLGKLPVSELERASLLFDIAELHRGGYPRIKRVLDVSIGIALGALLVLLLPFVLLGNLVGNRGPLWFSQDRVGKGGRPFRMLKLRTMSQGAGTLVGEWTSERDPRVTRFGALLRRAHLDELPQAWNILRGDLSVVGPRPEQAHYVDELTGKLPFYSLRHLVRPGLTGWAQVKFGYAASESDALEKLQYEFFYLGHQSLGFDLRIMGRTLRSIAGGEGSGR